MKLITDEGQVYNMVSADNQDKLENEIQLYVGGVRYVGELVESESDKTKEEILYKYANIKLYTNDSRLLVWIGLAMDDWAEYQSLFFQKYLSRYKSDEYVRTQKMYKEAGGIVTHRDPSIKDIYKDFLELKPIHSETMEGVIFYFNTGEETNNIAEIIKKRDQ